MNEYIVMVKLNSKRDMVRARNILHESHIDMADCVVDNVRKYDHYGRAMAPRFAAALDVMKHCMHTGWKASRP